VLECLLRKNGFTYEDLYLRYPIWELQRMAATCLQFEGLELSEPTPWRLSRLTELRNRPLPPRPPNTVAPSQLTK